MVLTCLLLVLTTVLGLFGVIYLYFAVKFNYWKNRGIPYLKPTFPGGNIGDVISTKKSMGQVYTDLYKQLRKNKFAGIYHMHTPALFIMDPEIIKNFLVRDFDHFYDHGMPFNDESIDPLALGLFGLTGKRWKELRYKLTPTFSTAKMKMMFPTVLDCADELVRYFDEPAKRGDVLEMKDVMARYTTDIIASCAFGIQCNCLRYPDAEFRQWGKKVFDPSLRQKIRDFLYLFVPSIAIALKFPFTPKDVTDFFCGVVKKTIEYREKNNVKRNDFMQLLIQLKNRGSLDEDQSLEKNEDVSTLTFNEIASQAFMFFTAGFESSFTTMSFFLYEMALNPEVQKRIQEEIDATMEELDGILTYDAVMHMKYLDMAIHETLRKYPTVPMLGRVCTKEYKLPDTDVVLEPGFPVMIPTMALHYDPQYYPDPDRYDPDRFREETRSQRHQFTFLPFGEGPRVCIGMRFAMMQMRVGLVSILSKYEVHVCQKTSIPIEFDSKSVILYAKDGYWLQIKNRTRI